MIFPFLFLHHISCLVAFDHNNNNTTSEDF